MYLYLNIRYLYIKKNVYISVMFNNHKLLKNVYTSWILYYAITFTNYYNPHDLVMKTV